MCVNPVETLPWNTLRGGLTTTQLCKLQRSHGKTAFSLLSVATIRTQPTKQILPSTNCFSANDPMHGFWSPARNQITEVKYISDGGNLSYNLFVKKKSHLSHKTVTWATATSCDQTTSRTIDLYFNKHGRTWRMPTYVLWCSLMKWCSGTRTLDDGTKTIPGHIFYPASN